MFYTKETSKHTEKTIESEQLPDMRSSVFVIECMQKSGNPNMKDEYISWRLQGTFNNSPCSYHLYNFSPS